MRIISGKARGAKIETIDSLETRPTLDRVRESLFNILQNDIRNSRILDLFAGSGALGIEALSRGAAHCIFCDNNPKAVNIIKQNLIKTNLKDLTIIYKLDYKKCIQKLIAERHNIDIVFIDPPYKADISVPASKAIAESGLINKNGIIIIETDEIDRDKKELSDYTKLKIFDERKYGRANLLFLRLNEEN